jgi:lipopolysaccharide biosynthesis protein
MALDGVVDRPRRLRRRRPDFITLADRARDAGQWELAAGFYRKALDRYPRNSGIWVQYGHALKESGELRDPDKLAQAELAYRRALSLDPGVADSHLHLGHVLKLQGKTNEAKASYLRAFALDPSMLYPLRELSALGWSEAHLSELQGMVGRDIGDAAALTRVNGTPVEDSLIQAVEGQPFGLRQHDLPSHRSSENASSFMVESPGEVGSSSVDSSECEDAQLVAQSGLFDLAWYTEKYKDVVNAALDPVLHYLRSGAKAGCDPHPLFDSDWYVATNPDVAALGMNPLVHYIRIGAMEGRPPHPQFDTAWYLETNPDVAKEGINPLAHYLSSGSLEGRAPNALLHHVFARASARRATLSTRSQVHVPNLFELRGLTPRGRIAVVLHLYYPDLWDEIRQAIEHISQPFDLFVSLVKDKSDYMRTSITQAFPNAYVFDFENRGRDIGPFLVLLQSGVLFQYELVCKLHTKRSPHRQDGDQWRCALIGGVLGSSFQIDQIISCFRSDPDVGMVIAAGNIYRGHDLWASNEKLLGELLPPIGISPDVKDRSFPGGSIFWIRPFLLRTLSGIRLNINDFEPEPVEADGSLPHAVERMFGLICEDAGMRVVESSRLTETTKLPSDSLSRVHVIALYLPQFHPIRENDKWWGAGFTEWTNVTRAKPLFRGHRQPRLPSDLGFYDLRLPEVREAQAQLARRCGLAAFCYYYYWFNGRRVLERPLDEVLESGEPDFPFLICWANEPWTRNWDGLNRDILLPQTYDPGWTRRFARDIAPLLRDRRYFRLDGKPMLLIYRIGHIPEASAAVRELRLALSEEGISEVHLSAAWIWFPEEADLPADPRLLGLDAYFEVPPHRLPSQPLQPSPPGLSGEFAGQLYDYNRTVTIALDRLDEPIEGRRHRGVTVAWDSTARKGLRAAVLHGATPANFRRWLRGTVAHERRQDCERVVFINAWNEWAEGTYLEPDGDFGCGWLEAVASATQVE